jgi:hypothetical protein
VAINDRFEKLVDMSRVCNATDLELEELNKIEWQKVGIEQSDYSIISATTYINPEMTIVKKVWHDGMTEYYYTA